jgi:FAD/FMN-containing dehydrogenase
VNQSTHENYYSVTFAATGMSFGTQALPSSLTGNTEKVLIDTRGLDTFEVIQKGNPVIVKVGGGLTWKQVHDKVFFETGQRVIPFDTPSADQITVGGALASNTFSRTSDVGGNYVSGSVESFTVMKMDAGLKVSSVECSREASEGSIERLCFDAIPGSMGAAGLIETVTIKLQPYTWKDVVHTEVLEEHSSVKAFVEAHLEHARLNRVKKTWNQGLYSLVLGNPARPYAVVVGSKKGKIKEERYFCGNPYRKSCFAHHRYEDDQFDGSIEMPLYGKNNSLKGWLIYVGHIAAWTSFPDNIISLFFSQGARYTNDIYNYTFYHNGYWEAHGGDSLFSFPTAHQAWAVPNGRLKEFMELAGDLLDKPDYKQYVYPYVLLQDVTPVPKSSMMMSPMNHDGYQIYQITVAANNNHHQRSESAKAFFRELSGKAHDLGVKVHLLKETHVDGNVLRAQYRANMAQFTPIRDVLDPQRMMNSELWRVLDSQPE